ncbi:hypothetical protein RN001_007046 [Aquatica leii]|uniref:Uncharacterized protein n=1 Tax=Aquatica leii TaxID=1421715 RepID=A0AAN7SIY3_9COLE|nr:hypothetical protein RN001_007046 [Aquatica leii]
MFEISTSIASFLTQSGIKTKCDAGIWLMFLLPLSLIISSLKHPQETSHIFKFSAGSSESLIGTSIRFIEHCLKERQISINRTVHLIPAATVCYWKAMLVLFNKFPLSFTVGELAVAAQALVLFCYNIITFYIVTTTVLFVFIVIILTTVLKSKSFTVDLYIFSKMVVYWAVCSIGAIIAVNKQITGKQKATPAVRKIFHLFTVAVYIPGLIYQC